MEAKGGGGGGGGAGGMRRVHIIYFLSRMGRIEHPHLIRVHHLSRNGVHLRDVKRWLSFLRGKDMPDSFAWSYKRRYKMGYVWQDLMDDDLITPVADNEYVLKGSEIPVVPFYSCSCCEKKSLTQKTDGEKLEPKIEIPPRTTEIEEESLEPLNSKTSTVTDDSTKSNSGFTHEEKQQEPKEKIDETLLPGSLLRKKSKKNIDKAEPAPAAVASTRSPLLKSKSYSSGASLVFRNLMACRTVDTNDSVVVSRVHEASRNPSSEAKICKEKKMGGSERILVGSAWNQQQHDNDITIWTEEKNAKKTTSESNQPTNQKTGQQLYCLQASRRRDTLL
ncbi:PREDICTED: uncharacterized protein LOC104597647 [Nelumbo nucifera]|uniref:SOSEKI DIX-like domain-containing protein n=2 Tax=Nelumbo nucifera TaxID=4432 RepID=A0A822ZAH7_NELNU|nr:PREDICTED: uncharacterized protein LOC104597647 [Nelumbo nucifera]DAD42112.1 TPA_asm: hypothetical protein HUJ06_000342 [Nelumbo nucifera]